MPRLVWAVLCRHALIDRMSAQASAIAAIDQITFAKEPPLGENVEYEMQVLTNWARDDFAEPGDLGYCRCSIVAPDGEIERALTLEVNLRDGLRVRNLFRYPRFTYRGPGEYRFRVEWLESQESERGELAAEIPLWVQRSPRLDESEAAGEPKTRLEKET